MQSLVKKAGILKAKSRLDEAKKHYTNCRASTTHNQYAEAWAKFLISSAAILHVIEGASRHTPQGRQWYGAKRTQCRKDPLILYLYQARNEEEHGIEPVTKITPGKVIMHVPEGGVVVRAQIRGRPSDENLSNLLLNPNNYPGAVPTFTILPPRPELLPVTSKEGDVFQPPKEHLGKPLSNGGQRRWQRSFFPILKH